METFDLIITAKSDKSREEIKKLISDKLAELDIIDVNFSSPSIEPDERLGEE